MKKIKVLLNFTRFPKLKKITFYRNVIIRLTGNLTFPTPDYSMDEATEMVDYLEECVVANKDNSFETTSALQIADIKTDDIFCSMADYVDWTSAGDEAKLKSSGFEVSEGITKTPKPELTAQAGSISGSMLLAARPVCRAGAYIWQIAKNALPLTESGWATHAITTRATHEVNGLDPTTDCYFRVAAITPNGTNNYTAAVMRVVICPLSKKRRVLLT